MASLSFGTVVNHDSIYREGIRCISAIDIEYAKKFAYTIKLLAIAKDGENKLELRVHPTLVPSCDMDGTLLNSDGVISKENEAALKKLKKMGLEVIIATGRVDLMVRSILSS